MTTTKTLTNLTASKVGFQKIRDVLIAVFAVEWIVIGLFFLLFIYSNIRQGAIKALLTPPVQQEQATPVPKTEATLPGIGKVKIDCVETALSQEAIGKLLQSGTSALTDDEKAKFEPCVIEKEQATPSPQP